MKLELRVGKTVRILAVDDDQEDIDHLRDTLKQFDPDLSYQVIPYTVMDSEKVLVEIANHNPDILVLDIYDKKRGHVGDRIVETVRKRYSAGVLPIILMSKKAVNPEKAALEAMRLGAQDLIWKGDEDSDAVSRIHSAVGHNRKMRRRSLLESVAPAAVIGLAQVLGDIAVADGPPESGDWIVYVTMGVVAVLLTLYFFGPIKLRSSLRTRRG